jgi:apolipoprotein N-acyltransferase
MSSARRKESRARAPVAGTPVATPDARGTLWARIAVCAAAGVALTFAFAPFFLFPLAWLSVAVLFVMWERSTVREAILLGFAFGMGLFCVAGYWPLPGLLKHGGYSTLAAVAAAGFVILLLAAHIALVGVARAIGGRHRAMRMLVVFPAAWALSEWLRTFSLTGFPWLSLGYAHTDDVLAGFAPVGGAHLVSVVSAVIAGALGLAWMQRERWAAVAGGIAALLLIGWGLRHVDWTQPTGRPLEIAAIQGNVPAELKWTSAHLQPTLDLYARETLQAMRARRLDAVIWPETAIPARPDQVAPFLAGLLEATRPTSTTVVFGIIQTEGKGAEARYFNGVQVTGSELVYRKRHLAPLTEYMPSYLPEAWRKDKIHDAVAIFSPGAEEQPPIRILTTLVGVTVCYETAFGRFARDPEGKVGMLLALTNDDWFMSTTMPAQDHQLARMRAIEAGREMLRVANSGVTAWIGADGRELAVLPVEQRGTLFARVQPRDGVTPYWHLGEAVWLLVLAAMAAGGAIFAVVTRPRAPAGDAAGVS